MVQYCVIIPFIYLGKPYGVSRLFEVCRAQLVGFTNKRDPQPLAPSKYLSTGEHHHFGLFIVSNLVGGEHFKSYIYEKC